MQICSLFSVVLLYLVHFLYFQYISHADFFNELFCVDRQIGHQGKSCQRRRKSYANTTVIYDVGANCKLRF